MVVFTCGNCGESVNKPKVEKHYLTQCRGRGPNLSCMDCFKDFFGNDYESHTKCISEEQRYSAKGFVAKVNKGEAKQNAWVAMVQTVLDEQKNAPRNVIRIVEEICKHSNTPRKKTKFINFVKNVCGHRTMSNDIDAAWDLISVKLSALSEANKNRNQENGNKKDDNLNKSDKLTGIKENGNLKQNDNEVIENGAEDITEAEVKTKKQRKEEKKRNKYLAALEEAAMPQTEEITEDVDSIKKKNKPAEIKSENVEVKSKKVKKRKNTEDAKVNAEIETNEDVINKKKKLMEGIHNGEETVSLHDQNVATSVNPNGKGDKFDWNGVIISLLQKKGNEMPFKRLQKKVLAEYAEQTGKETSDRIVEKLVKKLKGAPNVRVDKNRVMLIE